MRPVSIRLHPGRRQRARFSGADGAYNEVRRIVQTPAASRCSTTSARVRGFSATSS